MIVKLPLLCGVHLEKNWGEGGIVKYSFGVDLLCPMYIYPDELAVARERLTAKEEAVSKTKGTTCK